jgi:replicative DNA helicase
MTDDIEMTDQAEAALLGSLILMDSKEAIDTVDQTLRPSDFRGYLAGQAMRDQPIHARLFAGLLGCSPNSNEIAVATEMVRQGTWRPGDLSYIMRLLAELPSSPFDWTDFAEAVATHAAKRRGDNPQSRGMSVKVNRDDR